MNIPTSPMQNILIHDIRKMVPQHEWVLNFPVKITGKGYRRYPDVACAKLKLGFEYDGAQHRAKGHREADAVRDKELEAEGWWIIHCNSKNRKRIYKLLPKIIKIREVEMAGKNAGAIP